MSQCAETKEQETGGGDDGVIHVISSNRALFLLVFMHMVISLMWFKLTGLSVSVSIVSHGVLNLYFLCYILGALCQKLTLKCLHSILVY